MTAIDALISDVSTFLPFRQQRGHLLSFVESIKSKLWTLEILTQNLNLLVKEFLNSRHDLIDEFFADYLSARFGDQQSRKHKFCYTLLLSMQHFRDRHPYIALYYDLFRQEEDYPVYHFFWEIRGLALQLKQVEDSDHADLDRIFLGARQWQLILNQCLGFRLEQIVQFEREVIEKVNGLKTELKSSAIIAFCRGDEFSLTFFIKEALARFVSQHRLAMQEEPENVPPAYSELMERVSNIRISRISATHVSEPVEDLLEARERKLAERQQLLDQIREVTVASNEYKKSTSTLLAYLGEVDALSSESRELTEKLRQIALTMKKDKLSSEERRVVESELSPSSLMLLENGPAKTTSSNKKARSSLLCLPDLSFFSLAERVEDEAPAVRALIRRLRGYVFEAGLPASRIEDMSSAELDSELQRILVGKKTLDMSQIAFVDGLMLAVSDDAMVEEKSSLLDIASIHLLESIGKGLEADESTDDESLHLRLKEELAEKVGRGEKERKKQEPPVGQQLQRAQALQVSLPTAIPFSIPLSMKVNKAVVEQPSDRIETGEHQQTEKPAADQTGNVGDLERNLPILPKDKVSRRPELDLFVQKSSTSLKAEQIEVTASEEFSPEVNSRPITEPELIEDGDINKECDDEENMDYAEEDIPVNSEPKIHLDESLQSSRLASSPEIVEESLKFHKQPPYLVHEEEPQVEVESSSHFGAELEPEQISHLNVLPSKGSSSEVLEPIALTEKEDASEMVSKAFLEATKEQLVVKPALTEAPVAPAIEEGSRRPTRQSLPTSKRSIMKVSTPAALPAFGSFNKRTSSHRENKISLDQPIPEVEVNGKEEEALKDSMPLATPELIKSLSSRQQRNTSLKDIGAEPKASVEQKLEQSEIVHPPNHEVVESEEGKPEHSEIVHPLNNELGESDNKKIEESRIVNRPDHEVIESEEEAFNVHSMVTESVGGEVPSLPKPELANFQSTNSANTKSKNKYSKREKSIRIAQQMGASDPGEKKSINTFFNKFWGK